LFRILFIKREKKRDVGRPHLGWEGDIKIIPKETVLLFELDSCDSEYGSVLACCGHRQE
jgi:hypothetical protein